jgi:uracil-DNA glycosylase family 4
LSQSLYGLKPYQVKSCDGFGVKNCRFMFVGISAGKLGALKTSVPFTKDGSGRMLQRTLKELGLSKSDEFSLKPELVDCWITNLVKGRILDDKGNNRLPNQIEINYWWNDFVTEFETVNPKTIVAVGKLVYDMIRNNMSYHLQKDVRMVMHPRWYFSHGGIKIGSKASQQMIDDYRKVLDIMEKQ